MNVPLCPQNIPTLLASNGADGRHSYLLVKQKVHLALDWQVGFGYFTPHKSLGPVLMGKKPHYHRVSPNRKVYVIEYQQNILREHP